MTRILPLLALLASSTGFAQAPDRVAAMRDAALAADTVAADVVEGLTTEVGQRLAATEAEARARAWGVAKLKGLGFADVHVEPFDMPLWVRGGESAEIVAPFPQKLVLAALGNSGPTPPEGITARVVAYDGFAALAAAPAAEISGRIVFVTHHMAAQQDGGGYGENGAVRAPRRRSPPPGAPWRS